MRFDPRSRSCLPLLGVLLLAGARFGMAAPDAPPAAPPSAPAAATTQPDPLGKFAIFGGGGVTLDSNTKVDAGLIGSNGDVAVGPMSHFAGLEGDGRLVFADMGGGSTVVGPITFNGDIVLGQNTAVLGAISGGGNIEINSSPHITGNITATGNILIASGQGGIIGNVRAGGNFSLGSSQVITGDVQANGGAQVAGTVNGNLTCQDIAPDSSGQVTGKVTQGKGTVTPAKYLAETLPPADTFTVGKDDTSGLSVADLPLKPGHYAALNVAASQTVYLKPGDYDFDSITLGDGVSLNFVKMTPDADLHIFVARDVHVGQGVKMLVKGQPLANADTALAKRVLWEVLGNVTTGGSGDWFGTIFAPKGTITLGAGTTLVGSLISGGAITSGPYLTETFIPSSQFSSQSLLFAPATTAPASPATVAPGAKTPTAHP